MDNPGTLVYHALRLNLTCQPAWKFRWEVIFLCFYCPGWCSGRFPSLHGGFIDIDDVSSSTELSYSLTGRTLPGVLQPMVPMASADVLVVLLDISLRIKTVGYH